MKQVIFFVSSFLFLSACAYSQADSINKKTTFLSEKNSVPLPDAIRLVKNYREKRWKRFRRAGIFGKPYDARTCWFDLSKFQGFLKGVNKDLEDKAKSECDTCKAPVVSGFRFYYITYGKNDHDAADDLKADRNVKKLHSLIIVATTKINCVDTDILDKKRIAAFAVIQNQGTLCPPLPESACKGATLLIETDKQ